MTLTTGAFGLGVARTAIEFTSSWPAAGKTVSAWNAAFATFAPVLERLGAGAVGAVCGVVAVVVVTAVVVVVVVVVVVGGCVPSARAGAAAKAAAAANSPSRRRSLTRSPR